MRVKYFNAKFVVKILVGELARLKNMLHQLIKEKDHLDAIFVAMNLQQKLI